MGWTAAPADGVSSSAARLCWVSAGLRREGGLAAAAKKVPLPSGGSHYRPACRAERTDSEPASNTDFFPSFLFFFFNSYLSTYIFTFFNRLRPPAQDRRGSRLAFRGQCFCCSTQVHPSSLHRLLDVPTRGDPGNAFFPPVACVVDAAAGSSACFPSSFHSCFICFFFCDLPPHCRAFSSC